MLLHPHLPVQDRPFDHLSIIGDPLRCPALSEEDGRSGPSRPCLDRHLHRTSDRCLAASDRCPCPYIARMAALARSHQTPMLSHDDSQSETRAYYRSLGATVAEFPMHERVFLAAREAGDSIVLGAPNAMRGGSHLGSPGAADMISRGLCDILASDYFYPPCWGRWCGFTLTGWRRCPRCGGSSR